jgi:transposase-like protein
MRRVELRRRMTTLVRQWPSSGETQAVFAARHGVSATKLRYWLRRAASKTTGPVAFAPVQVIAPEPDSVGAIEIVLGTGERVVVPPSVSPEFLRRVLTTLR